MRSQHRPARSRLAQGLPLNSEETRLRSDSKVWGNPFAEGGRARFGPTKPTQHKVDKRRITLAKVWPK